MLNNLSTLALWAASILDTARGYIPEYPTPWTDELNPTYVAVNPGAQAPFTYGVEQDSALSQALFHYDTGSYGQKIELVHAYYGSWPTGVAVASDGTIFTCYPRGDDPFTLAVLNSSTTESPWPDQDWNTPEAFASGTISGFSVATEKFLSVQSVIVDGLDRVWALDTGRPSFLLAVPGGAKLVGFNLDGTHFKTYTFPSHVVFPDSLLNDVRIDARGGGFAYISDCSQTHPGVIVINLASGTSWRHLDFHPAVSPDQGFVPMYNGVPFYMNFPMSPVSHLNSYAIDGIALSPDGAWLYMTPLASRRLSRVPTALLKVQPSALNEFAILHANQAVQRLGELGSNADGLETDSAGYIYLSALEQNAITRYNPATGLIEPFVRDPAIQWPDTLSVVSLKSGGDYVYFTSNQLWLAPPFQNGTDLRKSPSAMFRVPIPAGKATQTK